MHIGRVMFDSYDPQARTFEDAEPLPPFPWHDLFAAIGKVYAIFWLLDLIHAVVRWQWHWLF